MNERTKKLFETLFSALILYRHNIHILHWKCCGKDFDSTHRLMDEYLYRFTTMIDSIGEIVLQLGENPLCLCSVMKNLDENNDVEFMCIEGDENYESETVYRHIAFMFKGLIEIIDSIEEDKELPSDVISVLDSHKEWLRLERDYKNIQRVQ